MSQSKALEFLQKTTLNVTFPGSEYATSLIIANVKTLSYDDSNSHSLKICKTCLQFRCVYVITCIDAAADSDTRRLTYVMTTDTSTDIDSLPADTADAHQPVSVTTDETVSCQRADLPRQYNPPVRDSPILDSPIHDSPVRDLPVHDLPVHDSPIHDLPRDAADSDVPRHSDDGVKHESDSSSHGDNSDVNDSDGVIVTGFQGDPDNDVVAGPRDPEGQGESDIQTTTEDIDSESMSSSQGDFSQFQGDNEQLNVDTKPEPGHHSDSDLDLVTSTRVEESQETLDDGTVVRRRTHEVRVLCVCCYCIVTSKPTI